MKKVYLIAVIFALIAGFATFMFARELDKKTTIKDADTVQVYVAAEDIEENTQITESMFPNGDDASNAKFVLKTVVAADAGPNYVTDKAYLIGRITADPIYKGEQINSARLHESDADNVSLSFKLEEGMVAYSIVAKAQNGVDGYIGPGDTVDIITFETDESGNAVFQIAYEDLKVLRVSNNSDNAAASTNGLPITSYSTITVEVTPEQALELREIEQKDYKLVLNSRAAEASELEGAAPPITTEPTSAED